MPMEPEDIAEKLTPVEAASIRHIGDCARGWWIHGGGANWAAVGIMEKRWPGLLFVGFPKEEDPRSEMVQLTDFGRKVRDASEEKALAFQSAA
jgi:hypothetical protein